jgi:diguanylate cyclase (GGDEF)-like protein/PAS domain S-box-containing protein
VLALRDPDARSVELQLAPELAAGGAIAALQLAVYDVTAHVRRHEHLATAEGLFHTVIEAASDAIVVADAEHKIVLFNRAAAQMFGWGADDVLGGPLARLVPERHRAVHGELMGGVGLQGAGRRRGPERIEVPARRRDGSEFPAEIAIAAREFGGRRLHVAVIRDISERQRFERELERLAHYDALTGLANRSTFHDRLVHALAAAQRHREAVALLFVDLDGFKQVNDVHGHAVGDRLLQAVAQRLRDGVRTSDTVARLGGDEFVVLLTALKLTGGALQVAEQLRQRLAAPYPGLVLPSGPDVHVDCSVGVALYPDDARDGDALLRLADEAMYRAKRGGKGRIAQAVAGPAGAHGLRPQE